MGGHLNVIRLLDLGGGRVDAEPQDIVVGAVLHHGRQLLDLAAGSTALRATCTKRRSLKMQAAMEEADANRRGRRDGSWRGRGRYRRAAGVARAFWEVPGVDVKNNRNGVTGFGETNQIFWETKQSRGSGEGGERRTRCGRRAAEEDAGQTESRGGGAVEVEQARQADSGSSSGRGNTTLE